MTEYDDTSWDDHDSDHDDELERWEDWPACPHCNATRRAVCPICETSGTEFPLAEWIPAAPLIQLGGVDGDDDVIGTPPLMLMCTTCDEAFAPNFYERCEHCGYDFQSGVVIEDAVPAVLNGRMLVVLAGLGVVLLALFIFFAIITR